MYKDKHSGKRYTQSQINAKLRKAKSEKLRMQRDQFGYNFCESCGINESNSILDCSHDKSIKKCKDEGEIELIWDVENITILCREEHQIKDKLTLKFNHI